MNLLAPPGFCGLDPVLPVKVYLRRLPHWRQDGATYFVTFRLEDSLPETRLRELRALRKDWEQRHPPPRSSESLELLARMVFRRVEYWLDQGAGSCVLKEPELAREVVWAMHHFDDHRYELGCYVVMPNHVHAVVRPLFPDEHPLEMILGGWKSHCAQQINIALGRRGQLWQQESFDRIIRHEEQLYRTIQYIGRNPDKAGIAREACPLWIRPQWRELGWTFERC